MRALNLNTGIDRLINAHAADSGWDGSDMDDAINVECSPAQRAELEAALAALPNDHIEEIVFGNEDGEVRAAMARLPKAPRATLRRVFARLY